MFEKYDVNIQPHLKPQPPLLSPSLKWSSLSLYLSPTNPIPFPILPLRVFCLRCEIWSKTQKLFVSIFWSWNQNFTGLYNIYDWSSKIKILLSKITSKDRKRWESKFCVQTGKELEISPSQVFSLILKSTETDIQKKSSVINTFIKKSFVKVK